jgi:hypothetical protein
MIRGKKNYLQPPKLEMAFGYIFKLDQTAAEDQQAEEDSRSKEWRYLKGTGEFWSLQKSSFILV